MNSKSTSPAKPAKPARPGWDSVAWSPQYPCYEITLRGIEHVQLAGAVTDQKAARAYFRASDDMDYRETEEAA